MPDLKANSLPGESLPVRRRYRAVTCGRPRAVRARLRLRPCRLLRLVVVAGMLAVTIVPLRAATQLDETAEPPRQLHQLRVAWGGGNAATWRAEIRLSAGSMALSSVLGVESDAGAALDVSGRQFRLHSLKPSVFGGAIINCQCADNAWLELDIYSVEAPARRMRQSIALSRILASPAEGVRWQLDDTNNVLEIRLVPGSELPIWLERPHLVFDPGETLAFSLLEASTPFAANSQPSLSVQITPARSTIAASETQTTVSIDARGRLVPQEVNVELPDRQGAWDVHLEIREDHFPARLGWSRVRLARRFQVVTVDNGSTEPPAATATASLWREVAEIPAAANNNWMPKIGALPPLRLASSTPPHHNGTQVVEFEGQAYTELAPGGWQAVPLRISELGKPHIVEIEYIDRGPLALGISVLQPDDSGKTQLFGADSGISIDDRMFARQPVIRRHRFFFWPRHKTPYLLFANRHAGAAALIGSIRVLAGPERLAPMPASLPGPTEQRVDRRRQYLGWYEQPLFVDNFAVSRHFDSATGMSIDDWQSWLEGTERWAQYLKACGYSGAMLAVAGDGSCLYPSSLVQPTSGFDNGALASMPLDPVRKDVVELVLRVFEREGLKLVPVIHFNAPIPAVERRRHAGTASGAASSMLLENVDGQTRLPMRSGPPESLYNPLHPEVQRAATEIVGELNERYHSHAALAGVGLVLSRNALTVIPGQLWGSDVETIQRFAASRNETIAKGTEREYFNRTLAGPGREAWLAWRQSCLADWYRSMGEMVNCRASDGAIRPLLLVGTDLFEIQDAFSSLAPSLRRGGDLHAASARIGLPLDALKHEAGIVVLRPSEIAPEKSLSARRPGTQLTELAGRESPADRAMRGVALLRHCSWAHFEQLQQARPFGQPESHPVMRLQPLIGGEFRARQPLTDALAADDPAWMIDGGWLAGMGQEMANAEWISQFTQMPAVTFQPVADANSSGGPAIVRQAQVDQQTWIYALNPTPWALTITLELSREGLLVTSLSDQPFPQPAAGDGRKLTFALQPWELRAAHMDASGTVTGYSAVPDAAAVPQLQETLDWLVSRVSLAEHADSIDVLLNPGFELVAANAAGQSGSDFGWYYLESGAGEIALQSDSPRSGATSLSMTSTGAPVWIRSNEFAPPATGRLSISARIRVKSPNHPPFRISVEGGDGHQAYYRFGSVEPAADQPSAAADQWRELAVHFDDLPPGGDQPLRIGFDLMGAGQVEIDDVRVYDRWLDKQDGNALAQQLQIAAWQLTSGGNIDKCRRILESYWPAFLAEYFPEQNPSSDAEPPAATVQLDESDETPRSTRLQELIPPALRPRF